MTTEPPISIVVPTYNRRDAVMRLVRSLSRQMGVDVQLVVVVEGSADGTLESLETCGIPNLEVLHHAAPRGVSAARNAGLERAEAEFVGFVDDDDFWSPARAIDAIEALRSDTHGAGWSSCGAASIDGRMKVIALQPPPAAETIANELYEINSIPGGGSALVARTELVRTAGGFSSEFTDLADWDLWLRLSRLSPLAVVKQYQIAYTHDVQSLSNTRAARAIEELARLRAKHGFGVAGNPDFDPRVWNRFVSSLYGRARDRSEMSKLWWREAKRTRSPLYAGRAFAHRVLPIETQFKIHRTWLSHSIRGLDPIDVHEVERWVGDVVALPVTQFKMK